MEHNAEFRTWRFDFTPSKGDWVDYAATPEGTKRYTLEQVLSHYGFRELLNVYGLIEAQANNEDWHIRFRENKHGFVTLFVSPASDNPKSIRYRLDEYGLPLIIK